MLKNIIILNFEGKKSKTETNFFNELSNYYKKELSEKFKIIKIKSVGIRFDNNFKTNVKAKLKIYLPLINISEVKFSHHIIVNIDRDDEEKFNDLVKCFYAIKKTLIENGFKKKNIKIKFLLLPTNTSFEYLICKLFDSKQAEKVKTNSDFKNNYEKLLKKIFKNKTDWVNGPVISKIERNAYVKQNPIDNLKNNLLKDKKNRDIPKEIHEEDIITYCDIFE
ncbi:hypothetical protein [Mesoplasma florum]|uniref:hypothetical protein n=1 Tax=Mesoplasma florum TaxID=2151 RepID=UPI000BE249DF|nr:hypothetical protein [Mesoplasma florum]ATI73249.1 hypothetical protein CQZ69_01570 [Mesoplasma florum]AVN61651.1 hypothetical protein CG004_01570 [Mesoplasma florum]